MFYLGWGLILSYNKHEIYSESLMKVIRDIFQNFGI